MEQHQKVLSSKATIRFQHCDPFNHLNNAEYLNYMVNAREDQLIENYDIDIYRMGRELGKSWVVGSNQIAYIKPAWMMEDVIIESQLLQFDASSIQVEIRMYNADKSEIKALMWSHYVHFNLLKQKRETHTDDFMELFAAVQNPVAETSFEARVAHFRKPKVAS